MVISIKNHLKDGVDLDCFNILNLIYRTIGIYKRAEQTRNRIIEAYAECQGILF